MTPLLRRVYHKELRARYENGKAEAFPSKFDIYIFIKLTSLFACVIAILSKDMQVGYLYILLLFIVVICRFFVFL